MPVWILYLLNVIAASGGLGIAAYINNHKRKENKPLLCPLHTNCDTVIHSRYSHLFGVPVEVLGILYYALSIVMYLVFVIAPQLLSNTLTGVMLIISGFAFLFSIYLTGIQLFLLRQWCTWCLMSAGICTLLFFVTLASWS